MTLGKDNGTDGQTDRRTDRRTDRVRRNMRPPPREEGRIISLHFQFRIHGGRASNFGRPCTLMPCDLLCTIFGIATYEGTGRF